MDVKKLRTQIGIFFDKYKYILLVLAVGLVFMLLPSGQANTKEEALQPVQSTDTLNINEELESILSDIEGAGKVRVMLTQKSGAETVYQTDEDIVVSESSTSTKVETIMVTDENRNDQGLVKQVLPATYMGAIVLCQGADDPVIRLKIADAVSKITGLGLDKIAILKMT